LACHVVVLGKVTARQQLAKIEAVFQHDTETTCAYP
jgi:hypothetical protein